MKADKFLTDNKKDGLSHFFITTKDIDTRELDENTYYPVIMNLPIAPYSEICMWNALEGRAFPSWGTHPSGGYNVSIRWTSNGEGYGSSIVSRRILEAVQCFCTSNVAGDIGQASQSSAEYIRVRGGGIITSGLCQSSRLRSNYIQMVMRRSINLSERPYRLTFRSHLFELTNKK